MNFKELILDELGLFLEKKTNQTEVKKLIKRILPYDVGIDLIRLGEDGDGGYLIPDDLKNIKYCYSAGVGNLTKFEEDLYEIYKIKSYMLDPGKISKEVFPKHANFINKFLSMNENEERISINNFIDCEDEILLKIDIEGDEYLNLINFENQKLSKVRILIIEFHDLRELRSKFFFKMFSEIIEKLSKHFYFCHLHPNNTAKVKKIGKLKIPDIIEVTLINKSRVKFKPYNFSKLPHKLDCKIDQNIRDIFVDNEFYK